MDLTWICNTFCLFRSNYSLIILGAPWQLQRYPHGLVLLASLLYTAVFPFLPTSAIPQVVFQSSFVPALSQTAGMQRLEGKMADSNYPLLPTWTTDCTNLHANGHVYYTRGIEKHKVPLINGWLCFCYKKWETDIEVTPFCWNQFTNM